jgi:hypothetical protein
MDIRKFHWMTEERCYEVTYAQFGRLLRFGRKDTNHPKIHMVVHLEAKDIKFMFPRSQRRNVGYSTGLLPFYAYMNHLFKKTMTPREGNYSKIPSYNKNILATMAPNGNEFSVVDFI